MNIKTFKALCKRQGICGDKKSSMIRLIIVLYALPSQVRPIDQWSLLGRRDGGVSSFQQMQTRNHAIHFISFPFVSFAILFNFFSPGPDRNSFGFRAAFI